MTDFSKLDAMLTTLTRAKFLVGERIVEQDLQESVTACEEVETLGLLQNALDKARAWYHANGAK